MQRGRDFVGTWLTCPCQGSTSWVLHIYHYSKWWNRSAQKYTLPQLNDTHGWNCTAQIALGVDTSKIMGKRFTKKSTPAQNREWYEQEFTYPLFCPWRFWDIPGWGTSLWAATRQRMASNQCTQSIAADHSPQSTWCPEMQVPLNKRRIHHERAFVTWGHSHIVPHQEGVVSANQSWISSCVPLPERRTSCPEYKINKMQLPWSCEKQGEGQLTLRES